MAYPFSIPCTQECSQTVTCFVTQSKIIQQKLYRYQQRLILPVPSNLTRAIITHRKVHSTVQHSRTVAHEETS